MLDTQVWSAMMILQSMHALCEPLQHYKVLQIVVPHCMFGFPCCAVVIQLDYFGIRKATTSGWQSTPEGLKAIFVLFGASSDLIRLPFYFSLAISVPIRWRCLHMGRWGSMGCPPCSHRVFCGLWWSLSVLQFSIRSTLFDTLRTFNLNHCEAFHLMCCEQIVCWSRHSPSCAPPVFFVQSITPKLRR